MSLESSSFRDPSGNCVVLPNTVYRFLDSDSAGICEIFLKSNCARDFVSRGQLVSTKRLSESEATLLQNSDELRTPVASHSGHTVLEHERISFVSYPYEW